MVRVVERCIRDSSGLYNDVVQTCLGTAVYRRFFGISWTFSNTDTILYSRTVHTRTLERALRKPFRT